MTNQIADTEYEALLSSQRRSFSDLCLTYEHAWSDPGKRVGLSLRGDLLAQPRMGAENPVVRRWGVAEASIRPTRHKNVPRYDDANSHHLTAQLAHHLDFIAGVETHVLEIGRRLSSWFGVPPRQFDWVVVCGEAPQVRDLGYWLNTAAWSVDLALDCGEVPVDFVLEPILPKLWLETIVSDLKWEIAASIGLTVPRNFRPPSAIADHPFAQLRNPFRSILDLWGCGVMLNASFLDAESTATLFVHASALSAGTEP
jgi:hypothetical protein